MGNNRNNFNKGGKKQKLLFGTLVFAVIIFVLILSIIIGLVIFLKNPDSEPIAVIYRGVRITKSEYTFFRHISAIDLINEVEFPEGTDEEEMNQMIKDYINGDDGGKSFWESVDEKTLENVKKYAIRKAEAEQKNITLTQDELLYIEATCDNMALYYDNADEFFLNYFGVTRNQYLNTSITLKKLDKLMDEYIERQNYSNDELKSFYEEKKDLFQSWEVRHILILTADITSDEDPGTPQNQEELEEKRKLAEDLLEKVKNGEDMEKLVEEYSDDPLKDLDKGLNKVTADTSYLFKDWVVNSKTGDVDLFETEHGYYIIKCEKSTNFADVKDMVKRAYGIQDYNDFLYEQLENDSAQPRVYKKVIESIDMGFFMENFN